MDKLNNFRQKIDVIDANIARLFRLRFKFVRHISNLKKSEHLHIADKKREYEVLNNIKKYSSKSDKKFMIDIYTKIINYSKKMQSDAYGRKKFNQ